MIFISLRVPLTVANAELLAARAELANLRPAAQIEQRALSSHVPRPAVVGAQIRAPVAGTDRPALSRREPEAAEAPHPVGRTLAVPDVVVREHPSFGRGRTRRWCPRRSLAWSASRLLSHCVAFPSRDRAGTVTVDGCTVRLVYLKPRARCHEDRNRERCKRDYAVGHLDRVELPHEFFVV